MIRKIERMTRLVLIAVCAATWLLAGCGSAGVELQEGKINAVASFYPLYDFTQTIGGEYVHAINLIPAGVEPHDWTPRSRDIKNITRADLFVYSGVGMESWVGSFLKGLPKDSKTLILEATAGADLIGHDDHDSTQPAEDRHDDDHDAHGSSDHGDEHGSSDHSHGDYDPHVWLSPKQSIVIAANIRDSLIRIDPEHRTEYEANAEEVIAKLHELDQRLEVIVSQANRKEIIVSHQALGYLARDYGLTQIAVMGLSPEEEPRAQDMKRISQFIRDNGVKYILFEELVSPKLAQTLAKDLGIETLVFNPLEGLTEDQAKSGDDYFSVMERNLDSLKRALE